MSDMPRRHRDGGMRRGAPLMGASEAEASRNRLEHFCGSGEILRAVERKKSAAIQCEALSAHRRSVNRRKVSPAALL